MRRLCSQALCSGVNPNYFHYSYTWLQTILLGYPNLLSGIIIGLGGIAITIIGKVYRRRFEIRKPFICSNCMKVLHEGDRFCSQCGTEIK